MIDELAIPLLHHAAHELEAQRFAVIEISGSLGASAVGVIHSVSKALAEAQLSIFYLSSYDTDFLLVSQDVLELACQVLEKDFTVIREDEGESLPQHLKPPPNPSLSQSGSTSPATVRRALSVDPLALHLVGLAPQSLAVVAGPLLQLILWPEASSRFLALCVTPERVSLVADECALRSLLPWLGDSLLSYNTSFTRLHMRLDSLQGGLGFDEPGIVEGVARPLASSGIPIFQISTFTSENTLINNGDTRKAVTALRAEGFVVED